VKHLKHAVYEQMADYVPREIGQPDDPQTAIPRIAKDRALVRDIETAVQRIPTWHDLHFGDARNAKIEPASVHLIVTSPPYWTLKEYRQ